MQSAVYLAFMAKDRRWYAGKANVTRAVGNSVQSGPVRRYREHMTAFLRPAEEHHRYDRYRAWSEHHAADFRSLLVYWTTEPLALQYEKMIITRLNQPMNAKTYCCKDIKVNRHRSFPRFRHVPNEANEMNLNVCKDFRAQLRYRHNKGDVQDLEPYRYDATRDGRQFECFNDLQSAVIASAPQLSLQNFLQLLYTLSCSAWLAVYIAERSNRLNYSLVWKSPDPIRLLLRAWTVSFSMPLHRAARVQRKIKRFLSTSGIFPMRKHYVEDC